MSNPLWGELQKAQDDAETIEEAIARLIVEHEEDPTAHLGEGESLQSHKSEEVIDHPARSVYDDKFAYDRNVVDLIFNTLDPYNVIHTVELNGIDSFLFTSSTSLLTAQIYGTPSDMSTADMFDYQLNPRMLTSFMVTSLTSQYAYFLVGERDDGRGFGFKLNNGALYGVYHDPDYNEVLTFLLNISANTIYKLEAVVTYPSQIDYYVNNTLVASVTDADLVSAMDFVLNIPWIEFKGTTSSTRYLYVRGFHWEADIPT